MECQELHRSELAEKYFNGQLDPATRDDFEVHILECPQCLQDVEAVLALREQLADRASQIRAYSKIEGSQFLGRWISAVLSLLKKPR